MRADRKWFERNVGFDPISQPPPAMTFANERAARPTATSEDFQREIIDFASADLAFSAESSASFRRSAFESEALA